MSVAQSQRFLQRFGCLFNVFFEIIVGEIIGRYSYGVWHSKARNNATWHGTSWHHMAQHGRAEHTVLHHTIVYDITLYSFILYLIRSFVHYIH